MKRCAKITLILLIVAFFQQPLLAFGQSQGPVYIVQPGDNLTSIADFFGTTVDALVEANNIENPSLLIPGTALVIPGYEGIEGLLTIQEVGLGENLDSLSRRYGLVRDDLARLNRLVSPGRLYAGQPLIIPEREGDQPPLYHADVLSALPGESRLEMAVRTGINPWSVFPLMEQELRTWVLPGSPLVIPGGLRPVSALPDPIVSIAVDPIPPLQGHTMSIRIELSQPAWVEGQLDGKPLHFFPIDNYHVIALQGFHALMDPGLYEVEIRVFSSQGTEGRFALAQPLRLMQGGYGFEAINGVPPETIDPTVIDPEQAMIEDLLAPATPDRFWEGSFQLPSNYFTERFLSVFGTRRSYNWGVYDYYHTGLDFYGGTGVEIMAPARGRVVYTGSLVMRGNVTYIDHGWGVYSGYFHQSEIFVQEGDLVEPGEVIGLVGGTGRSTGPHLHWEIWVGGVPVDPLDWVEASYP